MMENDKSIVNISKVDLRFSYLTKDRLLIKANEDVSEARPSSEPMATPLIWRYILLLKLNSIEEVAYFISSTNASCGIGGVVNVVKSSLSALEQIFLVSVNGTFVNKLVTKNVYYRYNIFISSYCFSTERTERLHQIPFKNRQKKRNDVVP